MLETIREYGLERLRAGDDLEPVRRRHAEEYLGLAVRAEPHLTADDQGAWLDRCEQEHANLRAALRWAIEAADADRAQAAAGALWRFWQQRGHLTEGRRWLEEVLAMPSGRAPTPARVKALAGAGGLSGSTRTSRRRVPTTTRPWRSSGGSATPPASARPCTTGRSSPAPTATSRPPPGCSRRAWSSTARRATRQGSPVPSGWS